MKNLLYPIIAATVCVSCSKGRDTKLFERITPAVSGVTFQNSIVTNDSVNVIDFQYCYNGGGVGVGDFNGDEMPDLVFSGNQVASKIYLNQGDFQFKDITTPSNFLSSGWATGVSVVDINADGLDDIYLNVGGAACKNDCPNQLFINQGNNDTGIPVFEEMADLYGLAEPYYSQQAVFFDYDLDGDLDAYIARNGNLNFDKNSPVPKRYFPAYLTDVFLENVFQDSLGHPVFQDVSEKVGVIHKGFSLGVTINDFNEDGLMDVYVANDFITNDLLYLNTRNADGTFVFEEASALLLKHQTYNAMGVDAGDINGDAKPDVVVLDMLPEDYDRQKRMMGGKNVNKFKLGLDNDYAPQFVRNTLQLNNGKLIDEMLMFSEVSFQMGIATTDWSWAPLIADFDLDGDNDLFISNGYGTDITDLDFINYTQQNHVFGTEETRNLAIKKSIDELPPVKLKNYFFENDQHKTFLNSSDSWVEAVPSLSNGASYVDLDLDGDLDLVINNINEEVSILQNKASEVDSLYYIQFDLTGLKGNTASIGAKVFVWNAGKTQSSIVAPVRGYLSSVDTRLVFGVASEEVDSIKVIWPSGAMVSLHNVRTNQLLKLNEADGTLGMVPVHNPALAFEEKESLSFLHEENTFNDFAFQSLLTAHHSKSGPCIAVSNLDGYVFLGGSVGFAGTLWSVDKDGDYHLRQELDLKFEDTDALFFDIDGDGDDDLYVASGGSEFESGSSLYEDRLYLNENGSFIRKGRLPTLATSTSCVRSADFDQDGDVDVFVGSGLVPRAFPETPTSHLLINKEGSFEIAQQFPEVGMVKDAVWADTDGDQRVELILVGDWMPITILKNENGKLFKKSSQFFDADGNKVKTEGWWRAIEKGDFDGDGDLDFLIANRGLNNFINPTQEEPVVVYKRDKDGNGSVDPVMGAFYIIDGQPTLMPLHSRDEVTNQLVKLKARYPSYSDFAKVSFGDLLEIGDLDEEVLQVFQSASILLKNNGDVFHVLALPQKCQEAPINDFLVKDFNGDDILDALIVGNEVGIEVQHGGYDAMNGLFLKGMGDGVFTSKSSSETGFYVPFKGVSVKEASGQGGESLFIVGQNSQPLKVFKHSN